MRLGVSFLFCEDGSRGADGYAFSASLAVIFYLCFSLDHSDALIGKRTFKQTKCAASTLVLIDHYPHKITLLENSVSRDAEISK
jgi:hypothetical protein